MLGFRLRSKKNGKVADETYQPVAMHDDNDLLDIVEETKEQIELFSEKLDKFISAVNDDYKQQIAHLRVELSDTKAELRKKNEFLEQLITLLIEGGAAKKPTAVDMYLAKKTAESSKPINLPGK